MNKDICKLSEAYCFSALKHSSQRRKGKGDIPYINHPVEVTNILAKIIPETDNILLIAALLHDTLEDTKTSKNEIEDLFGIDVLNLVFEVTDDMSLTKSHRRKKQIEKAPYLSDRAKLIKIADKICNIKDIISTRMVWTNRQKAEYIRWAIEVVKHCKGVNSDLDNEFDFVIEKARTRIKF